MFYLKSKFEVKTEIKLSYNFDHVPFKDLWRETVLIHSSTSRRQGRCDKNKSRTPSCRISSSGQRVRWGACRATTQIRRPKPLKQSQLVHLFFVFFCVLFFIQHGETICRADRAGCSIYEPRQRQRAGFKRLVRFSSAVLVQIAGSAFVQANEEMRFPPSTDLYAIQIV